MWNSELVRKHEDHLVLRGKNEFQELTVRELNESKIMEQLGVARDWMG